MKQLIQATLSIGLMLSSIGSADACCLWPFGGWWGAGYGGAPGYGYAPAPSYGYYSAGYPSYSAPAYGDYYSAGYASASDCCVPSCCNTCCNTCGSSSCVSGSCGGTTTTGSGSLKPADDPNFKDGTNNEDYDTRDRDGVETPPRELPPYKRPNRPRTEETNPQDDFGTQPLGGTKKDDEFETFGADPESENQIKNKPPMPEASDLPAVEPPDGTTFLKEESNAVDEQSRMVSLQKSLVERSSGLNEVVNPKRLASRSLPSSGSRNTKSWAGKSSSDKAQADAPIRWISVPRPDDQVRL